MEELLAVIGALIEAFRKRRDATRGPGAQPSPARPRVARSLRDLLAERSAGSSPASGGRPDASRQLSARAGTGLPAMVDAGTPYAALPAVASAPRADGAPPAAASGANVRPSGAAREAGLVRGIFTDPQTLVAALIAAEVLAPPVALRPAGTARGGTAL